MTIATCLEAGPLETQVLRMVESLRRWGGRYRDSPVLAYSVRFGPPLTRATRKALDSLGVTFRRINPENRYRWMNFYNKPLAMAAAEEEATTEQLGFLDGDVLVLGEPEEFALAPDEDFTAAAPDKTLGSCGPGDVNEPYWEAVCALIDLVPDDLPWVTTHQENLRIRMYWQGGIFVYRRSTGFAKPYLDLFTLLNDSQVVSHASRSFFNDQMAITLAMVKEKLRWRALSWTHNFNVLGPLLDQVDPARLREVRLLHYHDAFWPTYWPALLRLLKAARPDVHDWLAPLGPLTNPSSKPWKALSKALRFVRARRYAQYEATCRPF
jgi:hypothetical protein